MDYKEFEAMIRADEEKAAQYKIALESAKENGAKSDIEALSMAAAAVGCEFSAEQIEQHLVSQFEVSDDDLELVAGGMDCYEGNVMNHDEEGHDTLCAFSYHCYTVILHPDDVSKKAACWSNYDCVIAYEHDTL